MAGNSLRVNDRQHLPNRNQRLLPDLDGVVFQSVDYFGNYLRFYELVLHFPSHVFRLLQRQLFEFLGTVEALEIEGYNRAG